MISGSHIALFIGGMSPVLVPGCQTWAAEVEAEELDGTTAEDNGYDHPEDGIRKLTVTATLVVDITLSGPFAGITVGTGISNLGLYTHIEDDTAAYFLENAKVFRSTYRGEVKGRVTYDVTIRSVGEFEENI